MDKPVVAIECRVYNHEHYIRECLDSFIMQRTTFPFIVVVHDDASTDGSVSIIKEYETKYPEIIKPIYEKENQWSKHDGSIIRIIEDVILNSGARYVAVCEGDDYWTDPYKLQKQVDFLDNHPEYIACFHNAKIKYNNGWGFFNGPNESHTPSTEDIITRRWFISTQSLVYRNIQLEYTQDNVKVINGDYLVELLLAKEGAFYYMDDIMSVYRQDGTGLSAGLNARKISMFDQLIFLLKDVKKVYDGKCEEAFDKSIANYEAQKQDVIISTHPIKKWFYRKTYTRAVKRWMIKCVGNC